MIHLRVVGVGEVAAEHVEEEHRVLTLQEIKELVDLAICHLLGVATPTAAQVSIYACFLY